MAAEPAAAAEDGRGVCLATVTTAGYLPGTLVTIGSFLKAHPGFNGDVAVIHDDLWSCPAFTEPTPRLERGNGGLSRDHREHRSGGCHSE